MSEFGYQWEKLPSPKTEYTKERVNEFHEFTKLSSRHFSGKFCLDAGCGNGRYTYAMQQLGARVESFDLSPEAVAECKKVNPNAYVLNLMDLTLNPVHDFVLCWGVLHHLSEPREGFRKVVSQVKLNGILHIMVYHRKTQEIYEEGRRIWPTLNQTERMNFCTEMIRKHGGNLHGWWDAFNPKYNWSYEPKEVKKWFGEEGFKDITLTVEYNINIRGKKHDKNSGHRRSWFRR